jgi:hypothetical protein
MSRLRALPAQAETKRANEVARVAALEDEVRKLRTINAVLMERVELETDPRVDTAFSRMYRAIAVESSVSERTEALTALTRRLVH